MSGLFTCVTCLPVSELWPAFLFCKGRNFESCQCYFFFGFSFLCSFPLCSPVRFALVHLHFAIVDGLPASSICILDSLFFSPLLGHVYRQTTWNFSPRIHCQQSRRKPPTDPFLQSAEAKMTCITNELKYPELYIVLLPTVYRTITSI